MAPSKAAGGSGTTIACAEVVADCIGGYISWSLMTALPHLFFFYPLVKMDFTGWEASLAGYLIVGLLGIR